MTIRPEMTVAQIAAERPRSIAVFERNGIDFCCGGSRHLADVCAERGLAIDELDRQLQQVERIDGATEPDWSGVRPSELIRYILDRYHTDLRTELPRLEALLEKVGAKHASHHGESLALLLATFRSLRGELEAHMRKEEHVLFPYIQELENVSEGKGRARSLRTGLARAATRAMEEEHASAGTCLARMRELTGGYTLPEDVCPSFRALYSGLVRFEEDLHRHIHLENNILFPRALHMEDGVSAAR